MSERDNIFTIICAKIIRAITKSPFIDCLALGLFLLYFSENSFILDLLKIDTSTMQNWGFVLISICIITLIIYVIRPSTRRILIGFFLRPY